MFSFFAYEISLVYEIRIYNAARHLEVLKVSFLKEIFLALWGYTKETAFGCVNDTFVKLKAYDNTHIIFLSNKYNEYAGICERSKCKADESVLQFNVGR